MVDLRQPIQRRRDAYAVGELTLKCNLACGHCGSRAGDRRDDELSPDEALDLVGQLAQAGADLHFTYDRVVWPAGRDAWPLPPVAA